MGKNLKENSFFLFWTIFVYHFWPNEPITQWSLKKSKKPNSVNRSIPSQNTLMTSHWVQLSNLQQYWKKKILNQLVPQNSKIWFYPYIWLLILKWNLWVHLCQFYPLPQLCWYGLSCPKFPKIIYKSNLEISTIFIFWGKKYSFWDVTICLAFHYFVEDYLKKENYFYHGLSFKCLYLAI